VIFLFLILLKPALECVDGGKWWHFWAVIPAFILDVFIAHTTWALVFGWPERGEWTISHTLERIIGKHEHERWLLAAAIAKEINSISPNHIKSMG
jgi:hypothetical protein